MGKVQRLKEEIDRVNIEIQSAERDYDLNRWGGAVTSVHSMVE